MVTEILHLFCNFEIELKKFERIKCSKFEDSLKIHVASKAGGTYEQHGESSPIYAAILPKIF